mmetsp:Transcript_15854/g.31047  ORF Transcript_15854/g.31047 Transcript_15854/m.31047 type:complete len:263 (+) Transcript_15854:448-1236(+)
MPHFDDAVGHHAKLFPPHLGQFGGFEDSLDNVSTVLRGVGVQVADEDVELRHDSFGVGRVSSDNVESADTFAVQTKVLGKGLRGHDLVSLGKEVVDCPGILVKVARSKSLVSRVKPADVAFCLDSSADAFPLFLGRVNSGRVVSARVKDEDRTVGGAVDVSDHTFVVKVPVLGVPVAVGTLVDASMVQDRVVSAPGWHGCENGPVAKEFLDKGGTDAETASSGQGLNCSHAAFLDASGITQEHIAGEGAELGVARLRKVFFV